MARVRKITQFYLPPTRPRVEWTMLSLLITP